MVIQHECQITPIIFPIDESNILVNAVENRKHAFRNPKYGQRFRKFYGKTGQTIDTCYRKHGVPPHLQRNSNSTYHNVNTDGT